MNTKSLSVVIPARNEEAGLRMLLSKLRQQLPNAEIIVVDDGSTDSTSEIGRELGARVIRHPYGMGNGASIKSGARAASGEILLFMDADGQHDPADIPRMLTMLDQGYDMVIGARDSTSQANVGRSFANRLYNWFASWMVGHRIPDLTSGFRAVHTVKFREFLYLLPNGFSYPTTITMSFFRAGYTVGYLTIHAHQRIGKSHIQPLRDGVRFFLIIFKIGTLYSPLKLFLPISITFFITALCYYGYTYSTMGRFTNMSALLFMNSVVIFLIGLVSEQITALTYNRRDPD